MKSKILQFFAAITVIVALVSTGCTTGESDQNTPDSSTSPTGGTASN